MSKQPIPPPPGDKPVRTAPPPPPSWRHWLWPIAILAMIVLYLFLPALHVSSPAQLTYSQFTADASAHKIKTVTFASGSNGANTQASGDFTNGKQYTTIIPGAPTTALSQQLTADGVKSVTAAPPSSGLGTELLSWLILLLPLLLLFYFFRRMARGAGGERPACRASSASAGPGRRSSTPSGRRPSSPTWPATRAPRPRSGKSSTFCAILSDTSRRARWRHAGC